MTSAQIALALFTTCNTVRVFAYWPQIVRIGRDRQGAQAISYATWSLFAVSHLSTAFYALAVARDDYMAIIFLVNTLCCVTILALTLYKRRTEGGCQATRPSRAVVKPDEPDGTDDLVVWLQRSTPQARGFALR